MRPSLAFLLMLLFAAHLAGFAFLGLRRREWYYAALVLTFGLLTASFALFLLQPDWQLLGSPAYRLLRQVAWVSAAGSVSWTLWRALRRRRR